MNIQKIISEISEEEKTPLVIRLLEIIQLQSEMIQTLEDEIARLKGQKPKPRPKPSNLEKKTKSKSEKKKKKSKKKKTKNLEIDDTVIIPPENIPPGSEFKGYEDFTVQDLIISKWNILYRRERWLTPDGEYIVGKLPEDVVDHFGSTLNAFILFQYFSCHVTQPLIHEMLREFDIDISTGQISRILVNDNEEFHLEKQQILKTGLDLSGYINVDDTGSRHKGKSGYCTHIGNEFFAWFETTESKSRINFLKLLRAGHTDYVLNADAIEYMIGKSLPAYQLEKIINNDGKIFENFDQWKAFLEIAGIVSDRHTQIVTEGALVGSLIHHGYKRDMAIISDDAGQFNIFLHALCWVHAERKIQSIIAVSDQHAAALEQAKTDIWDFYSNLKQYKEDPNEKHKIELENRFDEIFTRITGFKTLDEAMKRIHDNKAELLLVLERPDIPLHNNLSESDIREYVKRKKISGSTRSTEGKKSRDTYTSLKKTCRKLGVSFWKLLVDRTTRRNNIPPLYEIMKAKMAESSP